MRLQLLTWHEVQLYEASRYAMGKRHGDEREGCELLESIVSLQLLVPHKRRLAIYHAVRDGRKVSVLAR